MLQRCCDTLCRAGYATGMLLSVFGMFLMHTITVSAYVDPSVMTYTIQAMAGILIALGSVIGVGWRRIQKKLSIFDMSITSVESDRLFYRDPATGEEKLIDVPEENLSAQTDKYHMGIGIGLLLSSALSFMLTIYGPLEIYFNNKGEFWYDIYSLGPAALKMFAVMFVGGTVLCFLLKKISSGLYETAVAIVFVILLFLYTQGNFLVGRLPAINGAVLNQMDYIGENILTVIILSGLVAFVVWFAKRFGKRGLNAIIGLCTGLVTCIMAVSLAFTCFGNDGFQHKANYFVSKDNQFVFSENENFIIILLDAMDGETLGDVLEEDAEARKELAGFTHYKNTVGGYPNTMYSIPFIFSGVWNENQEPFEQYSNHVMRDSVLFTKLEEENYRIGMYETDLSLFQKERLDRYDNAAKQTNVIADLLGFSIQQMMLVGYKYTPFFMKPIFNVDFNKIISYQLPNEGSVAYTWENSRFYQDIQNASPEIVKDKCFRYIHVQGSHVPYVYDRNVEIQKETDFKESVRCCVTIVRRYIDMMKDLGIYDNSTIIIMADHGGDPKTEGGFGQCPGLMIKKKGDNHEFRTSLAAVSYSELAEEMAALADGNDLFELKTEELTERRFMYYLFNHEDHIEEYVQKGYAWDDSTMELTGKTFDSKK